MSERSETHGATARGDRLPSLPLERDVLVARWRAVPAINYSALRSDIDGTVGRADSTPTILHVPGPNHRATS